MQAQVDLTEDVIEIPEIQRPRFCEGVLFLAFTHPELDHSIVDPAWFDFEFERGLWGKIIDWKLAGKPPDVLMFDHANGTNLYHICERFLNGRFIAHPQMWSGYVEQIKEVFEQDNVFEVIERVKGVSDSRAIEILMNFSERMSQSKVGDLHDYTAKSYAFEFMEQLDKNSHMAEPELKVGFETIDGNLWGLHRGEIVTVGARPAIGKSALMMNIAANLLKQKKRVLYFSTEMSAYEQWARLVPILTGIRASSFRSAQLSAGEMGQVRRAVEDLHDSDNFILSDIASPTIEQVYALLTKHSPDVAILDYLQRFTFGEADRPDIAIGEFMKRLKTFSRTRNVAVLLASQLNRQVESRPGGVPTMADLRASGDIEQESDVVILLYPEDRGGTQQHYGPEKLIVNIEKNRHGICGKVMLEFNKSIQRMTELPE